MIKLNLQPDRRVLAQFAWFALFGLPLVAGFVLRLAGAWSWTHPAFVAAIAAGAVQLVLFVALTDRVTKYLFVALSLVAMPIGFVLSHVLMMIVYYLVLTPIALVFRLMGRDVIGRRLEPQRTSYWHDRGTPRPKASYFKLY
jgi:hypothetical protein